MGYNGTAITNCNSPTIGESKSTFTSEFDASMAAIDLHDHTTTKGTQIPTGGIANSAITTAKIAASNVTAALIASDAVTTVKILDANVTTSKIADSNVTTVKIADSNVTTAKIADLNVTTAKINDLAVTAGKIATGSVTYAKRATRLNTGTSVSNGEVAISNTSGNFTTSALTPQQITNQSVVVNGNGGVILVGLQADGSGTASYIKVTGVGNEVYFSIFRNGSIIAQIALSTLYKTPPSSIFVMDYTAPSGANTYTIKAYSSNADSGVEVNTVRTFGYEL